MKKKLIISIALVLVLSFILVPAVPAGAQEDITIDGVLSDGEWDDYFWFIDNTGNNYFGGYPEFTYYKTNNGQDLYFGIIVNDPTPFENGNDDLWLAFRDAEDNYKEFRKGFTLIPEEMGKYSEKPFPSSYQPLPEGVEFGCSIDESHIYYEWKIPLALLGVSPGDTIKYLTHVREYPKPEGISSPINYHPEVTTYFTYSDRSQFGDLTLWAPPPTKADILRDNGVPGKGLDKAPGLQKPFNPDSKAGEHAGKK